MSDFKQGQAVWLPDGTIPPGLGPDRCQPGGWYEVSDVDEASGILLGAWWYDREQLFTTEPPASDPVHRPSHYNWHPSGVECIEIAGAFDYFLGNVIKYVWRADHKGKPVEDLRKAQTYLAKAIEQREAEA